MNESLNKNRCLSLVIPLFNEEKVLPKLREKLNEVLSRISVPVEVWLIDDGSTDHSRDFLRQWGGEDSRIRAIFLSRNYGHQVALSAGLDHAHGDAVVIMDADLQDPPDLIPEMLEKWMDGFHVVYAVRSNRKGELRMKKLTASVFYRLFRFISGENLPQNVGDFRLIDKKVVEAIRRMPERFRFVRGMVNWVGFRQCPIFFERLPRAAGTTKYPWRKMIRFALDAIFSFSVMPLRLATYFGIVVTIVSIALIFITLYQRYVSHSFAPGFSGLLIMILFFGGVNLTVIGILGEYIGRIYVESKGRPLYLVEEYVQPTE